MNWDIINARVFIKCGKWLEVSRQRNERKIVHL